MDVFEDFTVILDEYVVIDDEGFCFFWSDSAIAAYTFILVNASLHAKLLHV